jgi:hypothetical protein
MKAKFVIMTPEYAEALLKKNRVNRPFNRHACESYKVDARGIKAPHNSALRLLH